MDLLMEADAVYFENDRALFIPLKRDYIDHCLEQVPCEMPMDPGMNTYGTGATPPFLKRTVDQDLRPAAREEYEKLSSRWANSRMLQEFLVCRWPATSPFPSLRSLN
jgi:trimethylamine--corrinoid protein Co-methyltransferase